MFRLTNYRRIKSVAVLFGCSLVSFTLVGCGEPGEPVAPQARTVETLYWQSCASCHSSGRAGAPVAFNSEAWLARQESKSLWFERVRDGYRGMPARGMCSDCTDEELNQLIIYISSDQDLN